MLTMTLKTLEDTTDIMKYVYLGIIIVVVLALLIVFYFLVIVRNRYKKQAKDLQKKYQNGHDILTGNIEQALNRLDTIAHLNLMYIQINEDYTNRYHHILENNDKQSFIAVTSLLNLIQNKKYRRIKSLIDSTKNTINEFIKEVSNLDKELSELLQKDEKGREQAVILQRQFRDIKEEYLNHEKELQSVKGQYEKLFSKIEQKFIEFENLSNSAQYQESEEKLPLIKKILDALNEAIKVMPSLCSLTDVVIPNRIGELLKAYESLENEDYPLHNLKVNVKVEEFNRKLDFIHNNLMEFRLEGVKASLDEIEDQIVEILAAFEKEKEAKAYFDQNYENIYNHSYSIERQFMKLKRNLPVFKDVYLIKDNYLDDINDLQNDINHLGDIKKDLDTYVHSSTRQPYSILVVKLNDLNDEMQRIESIIQNFQDYLSSLKKDTESAFKLLSETYLLLKAKEQIVREMDIEYFSNLLNEKIARAYLCLDLIDEVIKVQPIDVEAINKHRAVIEDLVSEINEKVDRAAATLKYAEDSIVYANKYRQEFTDVRKDLSIAEKSFFEADFEETLNQTTEILKKMNPTINKVGSFANASKR